MNILYLKTFMQEKGWLFTPSPGMEWLEPEERAWAKLCGLTGLRYTPFPSRENQDLYWLDLIDREALVLQEPDNIRPVFDIAALLPGPLNPHPEAAEKAKHILKKHTPLQKLPAKFGNASVKEKEPVLKRMTKRASVDREQRMKALQETTPQPRDPNKPLRVQ